MPYIYVTNIKMQIQFSLYHINDINIIKVKLLSKSDDNRADKAYHQAYKYNRIQYC